MIIIINTTSNTTVVVVVVVVIIIIIIITTTTTTTTTLTTTTTTTTTTTSIIVDKSRLFPVISVSGRRGGSDNNVDSYKEREAFTAADRSGRLAQLSAVAQNTRTCDVAGSQRRPVADRLALQVRRKYADDVINAVGAVGNGRHVRPDVDVPGGATASLRLLAAESGPVRDRGATWRMHDEAGAGVAETRSNHDVDVDVVVGGGGDVIVVVLVSGHSRQRLFGILDQRRVRNDVRIQRIRLELLRRLRRPRPAGAA